MQLLAMTCLSLAAKMETLVASLMDLQERQLGGPVSVNPLIIEVALLVSCETGKIIDERMTILKC